MTTRSSKKAATSSITSGFPEVFSRSVSFRRLIPPSPHEMCKCGKQRSCCAKTRNLCVLFALAERSAARDSCHGGRESSRSFSSRSWLQIAIHPAVLKKSAQRIGCKGVPKHSWVKERKERMGRVRDERARGRGERSGERPDWSLALSDPVGIEDRGSPRSSPSGSGQAG